MIKKPEETDKKTDETRPQPSVKKSIQPMNANIKPAGDVINCPYCGGYATYVMTKRFGTGVSNLSAGILSGMVTKSFWGGLLGASMYSQHNRPTKLYNCQDCDNPIEVPL
ncbi:hypothetical protein M0P98_01025 [bacterium]|nr:hypothetical protein [bacterium]